MKVSCILLSKPLEKSRLLELAEACLRFSPQIAVREPNALFIEIGRCRNLYSEHSFKVRTQVILKRFETEGRLAISYDIPSSLALARYSVSTVDDLPIEALDDFGDPFATDPIGRKSILKMIDSLKRLGVQTVHQFKTIPPTAIPSRFGGLGLYCRQRIENAFDLPWPYWKPPEKFSDRIELLPSEQCSEIEPLLFIAKGMLDRIFSRLRARVLRAERIQFSMEIEKYSTISNPIRIWNFDLITPQGSTSHFLPILRERLNWDLSRSPIESSVTALSCDVLSTTPGQSTQRKLGLGTKFKNSCSQEDYDEAIGSLFGQLEEYLGKNRVFWTRTTEERFPEKSWAKTKQQECPQVDLQGRYPQRPTRIFKSPVPISIIQDRVVFKGKIFRALKWSRVERLSLDWLDDELARNYYQVKIEGGRTLWIFSDPGHHYFVHGYFE